MSRQRAKTSLPPAGAGRSRERDALGRKIERLESLLARHSASNAQLMRLANFPEQNPDILVELDGSGRVTYLNPVAQARFPELRTQGYAHPLLRDIPGMLSSLERQGKPLTVSELQLGDADFECQVSRARDHDGVWVRVYLHDITPRKRAEQAVQKLAKQIVHAQEEERRRLSRELHDEAGQALTALKLGLELLQAELPMATDVLRRNLDQAIALTESTTERIRQLALGLRPPALDTVGLNLTLEAFCREFARRTQLTIEYRGQEISGLADPANICFYRVLQEALTNVARHAAAGQVSVELAQDPQAVTLTVTDNGRGFDVAAPSRADPRLGLLGMRERLELLSGWLELDSAPGQGCRLRARIPAGASQ
jgi:signal transduction histidine kinase